MKKVLSLVLLALLFSTCKKENSKNEELGIPNPMTSSNGWKLVKHSPEFYTLTLGTRTLDMVKEHNDGIDILYSTVYALQDLKAINVRWRAYHSKDHDVKKVVVTQYSLDYLNRPIASKLLDVYSSGLGENDLFAVNEQKSELSGGRILFDYSYYNVKSLKSSIEAFVPIENTTYNSGGIGSAKKELPFVSNGLLIKQFNSQYPIYNPVANMLAGAPKGKEIVMFGTGANNKIYVFESTDKVVSQVISSKNELVRPVVIKHVWDISQFTQNSTQNDVIVSKFFYDKQYLYIFMGLSNKKHRFFKINLDNYTISSENESMYETIDLDGYKNILLLEDRPGQILSMEKDGIYLIANNTKTFIPSPSIQVGSTGTSVYYSNGKIWQVLFDENGAYLISKTI